MNNGTLSGFNKQKRLYIPDHRLWTKAKLILNTTSTEVAPPNVYKVWVHVIGAGGGGGWYPGAGGGYASGIINVIPGQLLPTITIGASGSQALANGSNGGAGGTTSFGTLLTATGGPGGSSSGGAGGAGTVNAGVINPYTANGGAVFLGLQSGGGAPGSPYGTGGTGTNYNNAGVSSAGGGIGGMTAPYSATTMSWQPADRLPSILSNGDTIGSSNNPLILFANKRLQAFDMTYLGMGGEGGGNPTTGLPRNPGMFGGGGGASSNNGSNGGIGGGGGGSSGNPAYAGGQGGAGCCILIWEEAQWI